MCRVPSVAGVCLLGGFGAQFNRLILGKMLSGLGYEVIYGQNGVEAVNFYSQHAEALLCVLMVSS